jgi:hypothetical protein
MESPLKSQEAARSVQDQQRNESSDDQTRVVVADAHHQWRFRLAA